MQLQTAGWMVDGDKPLPNPPSPTLTNPDMVLPTYGSISSSPPRLRRRPPSPSYLRDKTNEVVVVQNRPGRQEKRGLMSRKMMFMRSQSGLPNGQGMPQGIAEVENNFKDFDGVYSTAIYASSPTVDDPSLLTPAGIEDKRVSSGSSFNSEDLKHAQQFLAKYDTADSTATDDESVLGKDETPKKRQVEFSSAASVAENEHIARRKEQEAEEQNSAMLSQRAEQILANAKKRLNLMEGNLRGARDLVAPLTAANLKRATSLGSSHVPQSSVSSRSRFVPEGYRHERQASVGGQRMLHSQASSPTMGHQYRMSYSPYNTHARGFSETEVPERSTPSLSRQSSFARSGRFPVKAKDGSSSNNSWTHNLRGSKSQDMLGYRVSFQRPASREKAPHKGSPDTNLDPLLEDDASTHQPYANDVGKYHDNYGLGLSDSPTEEAHLHVAQTQGGRKLSNAPSSEDFSPRDYRNGHNNYRSSSAQSSRVSATYGHSPEPYRSPSVASDLRSQMSNLKGKISTLRDRAREDSMRRQSLQSLRTPSPLNNATHNPPETFYMQSENYGSPVRDTNGGRGWSAGNSPHSPPSKQAAWEERQPQRQDRNTSFEPRAVASPLLQQRADSRQDLYSRPQSQQQWRTRNELPRRSASTQQWHSTTSTPYRPQTANYRATSAFGWRDQIDGRAEVERKTVGTVHESPSAPKFPHHQHSKSQDSVDSYDEYDAADDEQADHVHHEEEVEEDEDDFEDDGNSSEAESLYEDAPTEQQAAVPHEDRADAFDYQQFFLHSAMATYGGERRGSISSEESDASTETARAPTQIEDADFDASSPDFPPPSPETPQQLRNIELNLHKRTISTESISTVATFETAIEGRDTPSPTPSGPQAENIDWSTSPVEARLTPAVASGHSDDGSDRADSGVGLPRRSEDNQYTPHHFAKLSNTAARAISPAATSPSSATLLHDPATLAVNSLTHPESGSLGLKDKAVLFSFIESLRSITHQLQDVEEGQYESRVLRRRLDDARRVLEGTVDVPATAAS